MASSSSCSRVLVGVMICLAVGSSSALSTNFYSQTCPNLMETVQKEVQNAVSMENRMGASLLRLHFHDCFVNGCDGSILLDDTLSFKGEKTAGPNSNSVRGFDVIDKIKFQVEEECTGLVSCADILAIAARDSVVALGGPNWDVKLGRRDSRTANFSDANSGLPSPFSDLNNLIDKFQNKGLDIKDMVVLSGAHTIGQARCATFRTRIYNETNIDNTFAATRQSTCPFPRGSGDANLAPLDIQSAMIFNNQYFKNLVGQKGLLHSDQVLYNGESTDSIVEKYSQDPTSFNTDFVAAMVKMGDISPLTGSIGEIRRNCRFVNS